MTNSSNRNISNGRFTLSDKAARKLNEMEGLVMRSSLSGRFKAIKHASNTSEDFRKNLIAEFKK